MKRSPKKVRLQAFLTVKVEQRQRDFIYSRADREGLSIGEATRRLIDYGILAETLES